MTMTVGELRRALEGLPDDLPVLIGDDYDDRAWDRLGWAGATTTLRPQRMQAGGPIERPGVPVLRLGDEPPGDRREDRAAGAVPLRFVDGSEVALHADGTWTDSTGRRGTWQTACRSEGAGLEDLALYDAYVW